MTAGIVLLFHVQTTAAGCAFRDHRVLKDGVVLLLPALVELSRRSENAAVMALSILWEISISPWRLLQSVQTKTHPADYISAVAYVTINYFCILLF